MSYRANQCQQLSIFDRSLHLTERERKCLENSWAKVFSDEIFPAIDEERFRVLYSENASRPNTPVNVIVGALIIKELFDLSDDEVVENLMPVSREMPSQNPKMLQLDHAISLCYRACTTTALYWGGRLSELEKNTEWR